MTSIFLVTTCLKCNATVKVSECDRREVESAFDLAWKDGVLSGSCDFAGGGLLKRAVLYRNERPVTSFGWGKETILPVRFAGVNTVGLGVEKGRIACAVKSFETNGAPHFAWNETSVRSIMTPDWMRMAARLEVDAPSVIWLTDDGETCSFSPRELVGKGRLTAGKGHVRLGPDGTIVDHDASCSGLWQSDALSWRGC